MKTNKLIRLVFVLMLWLTSNVALAQTPTVSGSVTDSKGNPIPGATVYVKGGTEGTITDLDGRYSLNVSSGETICFSFIGYQTLEFPLGQVPRVVSMEEDNKEIEEVVVVGYGQQKKASVVGAITQTSGKVLERTGGVSDLGSALTGNLPGVVTTSSTGMPGDEDPQIVIRGVSSWNGSSPLILVDGIERTMSSVDINSVASISVLKDASATAVYGVKGANGVILITTKRGNDGKAKIEAGYSTSMKFISKLPSVVGSGDALLLRNQAIENELGLSPTSWQSIVPMSTIDKYNNPANEEEAERYPDVDWQDWLFKDYAMSHNAYVNISGGTDFVKYFAAVDYQNEGDLFEEYDNGRGYQTGYNYNRMNTRANLDFQLTKTTLLKANIAGSYGVKNRPWGIADDAWAATQLWQAAYSAAPDAFMPIYSDGSWGYYPSDTQGNPNSIINLANSGLEKRTTTRINTDFTLEQDLSMFLKGLKVSGSISWDNTFYEASRGINDLYHDAQLKWIDPTTGEERYSTVKNSTTGFDFSEGKLWSTASGTVDNTATYRNLFYQGQIFWGNSFGNNNITAMGVFNRNQYATGSEFQHYREDWAFRVTYDWANKYFVEYNGAYNGSEKFSSKNRFAFFNSGAIGWMISNEEFFKPIKKYVEQLKVRYSYGEIGDDNVYGRWLYATQWAYYSNLAANMGTTGSDSPYHYYAESQVGNEDVHWEKAVKQNFGIDYAFFGGLVIGSVEIFNEKRSDILIDGNSRAIPSYYGATAPVANLGKTENKGYEIEVKVNHTFDNKLNLWANCNITHAEGKIIEYDDPELKPDYQKKEGYAIDQDHSYLDAGYAQTWDEVYGMTQHNTKDNQKLPGQYIIVDFNGDGVIDSDDQAPYGYTGTPQNTYSYSFGAEYKGWSFFAQFYAVNNVDRYVCFTSLSKQRDVAYDEDYWTLDNSDAWFSMPRWLSTPDYTEGTRYHYDGSYIRLKNVELAYTFTQPWVRKAGMSSLKFYISGNNLWVKTDMPDDRESNFAGTGLASQGAYPTMKRYTMGVKVQF